MSTFNQALTWTMAAALMGPAVALSRPNDTAPVPADPTDARATVPRASYTSPLAGIRPMKDAKVAPISAGEANAQPPAASASEAAPADPHARHAHHPASHR